MIDVNTMTDRLGDLGDRIKDRRTSSKIDHLGDENQRLRTELRSLRSMLDRERSDRQDILEALKEKPTVVKKKKRGFLRMLVVGGGAYVLGTRAGRQRYEQIVDWAKQMKNRGREATDEMRSSMETSAGSMGSGYGSETGRTGSSTTSGSSSPGSSSSGTSQSGSGSTGSTGSSSSSKSS